MGKCPVCGKVAKEVSGGYECDQCGRFKITEDAIETLKLQKYDSIKAQISSYLIYRDLRKYAPITVCVNKDDIENITSPVTIDEIISQFPRNINDRVDKALMNLSIISQFVGNYIHINGNYNSIFYCDDISDEATKFMTEYLEKVEYIEQRKLGYNMVSHSDFRLTFKGWSRIAELETVISDSKNVFIAMAFDVELREICDNYIEKAISDAGYKPIRVDEEEYNSKICDRIIADIRKAKFVVADVTGQKNGVYFEAGFAMGLGKPVIWTCRKDDINNLHFDTRQYNHIVWENEEDLYEALLARIQATIY